MSQDNTTEPTNETVTEAATKPDALPLGSLMLIGVAGDPDDMRALLRTASGQIMSVKVGEKTRFGTVEAVAQDGIVLSRSGKLVHLAPPAIG